MPALSRSEEVSPLVERLVASQAFGTKSGSGFYQWTSDGIAAAKLDRDRTVRLMSERRHGRGRTLPR